MNALLNWYFEKCSLSHLLLGCVVLWATLAWLLLKQVAPVAYVGLHVITTGVFLLAFLRADKQTAEAQEPKN